jgi:hypothetical protein
MPPDGGGALEFAVMSDVENMTRLIGTNRDYVKLKM